MPRVSGSTREHRGLIAVIEDDVSLNQAICRQLAVAGFHTSSYQSGMAVLSARGRIADCLVLDVHLPDMTGFELLRQLGTREAQTPIVVITAHDDPMHRRAAEEVGAIAYLTKPFSRDALLEAVARAVARKANRSPDE
jgi:FixJ family two-component response regulator